MTERKHNAVDVVNPNVNRAAGITYLLLRVVAGFLFFQAGSAILFGWFGGMPGGQEPPLLSEIGIGGVLEFIGGIAIMLGSSRDLSHLYYRVKWRSLIGSFMHRTDCGRLRIKESLRCSFAFCSCIWRPKAEAR